jgi:hypothetical protein
MSDVECSTVELQAGNKSIGLAGFEPAATPLSWVCMLVPLGTADAATFLEYILFRRSAAGELQSAQVAGANFAPPIIERKGGGRI